MARVAACSEKPSRNADSEARHSGLGHNAGAGVADVASSASNTIARSIGCVRPYGKLASVVSIEGSLAGLQARNQTLYFGFMERTAAKIQALSRLVERRQLRPVIDSVFPLERIADAHRKIEGGGMRGKIAITVDG
jgi:NADPH2:quinone reductase